NRSRPDMRPPVRRGLSVLANAFRAGESPAGEVAQLSHGCCAVERAREDLAPVRQRLVRVACRVLEIVRRDRQMMHGAERCGPLVLIREQRMKATQAVAAVIESGAALLTTSGQRPVRRRAACRCPRMIAAAPWPRRIPASPTSAGPCRRPQIRESRIPAASMIPRA